MSNKPQQDDTQPRSPLRSQSPGQPVHTASGPADDGEFTGPGCLVWGVVSAIMLVLALLIVGLAAAAGWTGGQRIASANGTATQAYVINEQLARIPTDIAGGNEYLISVRLDFLAAMTPGVPAVPELRQTATAVHLTAIATPTPTPTAQRIEVTEEATAEATAVQAEDGYDLAALLSEAQRQVDLGMYEDAIETLDAIIRIDSNYQRTAVRSLMSRALRSQAAILFRSLDTLAEAINLTNLAEQYGPIGELDYERYVAGLYLDAIRTTQLGNYAASIRSLNELYQLQTTYKGVDIGRLLFTQYVSYGDAWVFGGNNCAAVPHYDSALRLFSDSEVRGKRDAAQTACELAQTATPFAPAPGAEGQPTIAPVGQPGG